MADIQYQVLMPDGAKVTVSAPEDMPEEQVKAEAIKAYQGQKAEKPPKDQEKLERLKEFERAVMASSADPEQKMKAIAMARGSFEASGETPKWTGDRAPEPAAEPAAPQEPKSEIREQLELAGKAGAAGAGAYAAQKLQNKFPGAMGASRVPSMPPSMPPSMGAPGAPMGAPMGAPVAPMGAPAGGPAGPVGGPAGPAGGPPSVVRQGGSGTFNYGKAFGLTDIEAGRALDMTKNPGGANDLLAQRREALQRIQQMGGGFAENPRYGGLMTPEQGVGGGPRASFTQTPQGLSPLPPPQPVPTTPQQPGPLSRAGGMAKQAAGAVLGSPKVMGALGGLGMAEQAREFSSRQEAGDVPGMVMSGAGVAGGALQMVPHPLARALGATVSAASPLTLWLYDRLKKGPEPVDNPAMEPSYFP